MLHAIRGTGGKNAERILIFGSPRKKAKPEQETFLFNYNDRCIMAEWDIYASGPNKIPHGKNFWKGDGKGVKGQIKVKKAIRRATLFYSDIGFPIYVGTWMPQDNKGGDLKQKEVIKFARFFVSELCRHGIPRSLSDLDRYYDTEKREWITKKQKIKKQSLNMSKVLDNIQEVMPKTSGRCPLVTT